MLQIVVQLNLNTMWSAKCSFISNQSYDQYIPPVQNDTRIVSPPSSFVPTPVPSTPCTIINTLCVSSSSSHTRAGGFNFLVISFSSSITSPLDSINKLPLDLYLTLCLATHPSYNYVLQVHQLLFRLPTFAQVRIGSCDSQQTPAHPHSETDQTTNTLLITHTPSDTHSHPLSLRFL